MQVCPRCGYREAMKVPEAAEKLGVSGQTIRNWIKSGRIEAETEPVQGSGYQYLIPVEVVESEAVQAMAEVSRSQGRLAKAGREAAK